MCQTTFWLLEDWENDPDKRSECFFFLFFYRSLEACFCLKFIEHNMAKVKLLILYLWIVYFKKKINIQQSLNHKWMVHDVTHQKAVPNQTPVSSYGHFTLTMKIGHEFWSDFVHDSYSNTLSLKDLSCMRLAHYDKQSR